MSELRRELRALLFAEIDTSAKAKGVLKSWGIDKERWLRTVRVRMKRYHRAAFDDIAGLAVNDLYQHCIGDYIRSSRNAAVENLTDLEKIKKEVKKRNRMVQVKSPDGTFVTKREAQCTPVELEVLAAYHDGLTASHKRRATHYRLMATQMRLAGFADTDPLSKFLAS